MRNLSGGGLLIEAAHKAGADQELEACCEWLREFHQSTLVRWDLLAESPHVARRPKPPSLKEQAFAALKNSPVDPVDETASNCRPMPKTDYPTRPGGPQ
jgi:hypothetical protein